MKKYRNKVKIGNQEHGTELTWDAWCSLCCVVHLERFCKDNTCLFDPCEEKPDPEICIISHFMKKSGQHERVLSLDIGLPKDPERLKKFLNNRLRSDLVCWFTERWEEQFGC